MHRPSTIAIHRPAAAPGRSRPATAAFGPVGGAGGWRPLPACASAVLMVSLGAQAPVAAQEREARLESVTVVGTPEPPALLREVESASRLGLKIREIPATVEAPSRQELQDRGVRTVSEAAQAVTGVTAGDFPAEPSNFSMRGFANSQINTLYNGIKIGPPNMTSRVMDVGNLERIEFLKGPASLMSGEGASGGSVNLVTRRPHRGPVETEVDVSAGSFGTNRVTLGSGGTTALDTLDYRFDVTRAAGDGFISETGYRNWHLSGGLDWYVRPGLKLWGAAEFKKDTASPYWGTPLVSADAPGIQPRRGVVSGTYVSGFNGSRLGDVTLDQRTLRTNYNVLDARNTAEERWLRAGADWRIDREWTLRTQFYRYSAEREWRNNEVTAFNVTTGLVDRERFFVAHDQTVVGNRTEAQWDAPLAGMRNRLVLGLDWSQLTF